MSVHLDNGGKAVIEGDEIVIRLPIEALPDVIEGAWSMNALRTRYQIVDGEAFAKELTLALNREDEQGTTPIHRMCDKAIEYAIDQGAEGIEEHPDQEA